MSNPAASTAESSVSTDTWTLTATSDGFDLLIHPLRIGRRKALSIGIRAVLLLALTAVMLDIQRGGGIPTSALTGAGVVLVLAAVGHVRRTWKHEERLVLHGSKLTHDRLGPKGEESRTVHLGPTVEIESEPRHLGDGVRYSLAQEMPTLTLHTAGRTLGIGAGLDADEAVHVVNELSRRVAPDRRPHPGSAGEVYALHFPIQTGEHWQQRYVGRQMALPISSVGAASSTILVASLVAMFISGGMLLASAFSGEPVSELVVTVAIVAAVAIAVLLRRRGLLDRWLRHVRAATDRGPGEAVRCTALRRIARTNAFVGLPVVGGVIAWAGTPPTPWLVPFWAILAALALIPMTVYVWQLAFAGTTEVRLAAAPAQAGGTVELRFALHRDAAPFESIAFRLVRTELRRRFDQLRFARYWTTHEGVYHLPADTPPPGPNEEVPVFFAIPADAGGSDDHASPAIRWFLEVRGVTDAGPYIEAFPLPIGAAISVESDAGSSDPRSTCPPPT